MQPTIIQIRPLGYQKRDGEIIDLSSIAAEGISHIKDGGKTIAISDFDSETVEIHVNPHTTIDEARRIAEDLGFTPLPDTPITIEEAYDREQMSRVDHLKLGPPKLDEPRHRLILIEAFVRRRPEHMSEESRRLAWRNTPDLD